MTSFDGGIKSITSYKHEELIDLCGKLGIEINSTSNSSTKKKTKKDLYEMIILHF